MNASTLSRQAGRRYRQSRSAGGIVGAWSLQSTGSDVTVIPRVDVELSLNVVRTVTGSLGVVRTQSLSLGVVRTLARTLELTS